MKGEFEIIRNGNMKDILEIASEKSVLELAMKVSSQAKTLAPFEFGRLRNAIMYKNNQQKGAFNDSGGELAEDEINIGQLPSNKEAVVGFNLSYGIYQEFGTRHMKPQPFMRPAIALYQGQKAVDVIKKIHDEELRGKLRPGQKRETFF